MVLSWLGDESALSTPSDQREVARAGDVSGVNAISDQILADSAKMSVDFFEKISASHVELTFLLMLGEGDCVGACHHATPRITSRR